jgi:hypothetical protein
MLKKAYNKQNNLKFTGLKNLCALSCLLIFFSCNKFGKSSETADSKVIARVFDKYLYLSDVSNIVPKGTSKNDSIVILRNFVNSWVQQQVILKKANDNLEEEQKDVDQKLEEYRNSLNDDLLQAHSTLLHA